MGKRGFIAYDPVLARDSFNADPVIAIYYLKLLRYDTILDKDGEGYFVRTEKQIEKATCIKRRQQERIKKWLERHNFITTMIKVPEDKSAPHTHFRIVDNKRPM
jgi:hypothetical protein